MRFLHAAPALAALLLALVPAPAAAVDPCAKYGVCTSDPCALLTDGCGPLPYLVQGCSVNAFWVSGTLPLDGCAARVTLSSCDVEWFGGHGIWSARITCEPVLTLP